MWIELQHALQVLFGVTIASVDREQMRRAAELPDRVISGVGFLQLALCQREIPIVEQIDKSQDSVGLVHRWNLALCQREIPIVEQIDKSQDSVGLVHRWIKREGALSILARERHVVAWRLVEHSQRQVAFRHRRIRKRKGGVEPNGFLKIMNGFVKVGWVVAKACSSLAAQKILKCGGTRSERSLRPRCLSGVE